MQWKEGWNLSLVAGRREKVHMSKKKYPGTPSVWWKKDLTEGGRLPVGDQTQDIILWDHFHLCVRNWQQAGMTMDEMQDRIEAICRACRHLVIISDEVGNGIVPLQKGDRVYRDLVGNLLIGIASKAERVDRIICQIPQQIK